MLRIAYYGVSSWVAVAGTGSLIHAELAPWPVAVAVGGLVVASSTWPGLAAARYKDRWNPAAALARGSAHVGYMLRTSKDQDRSDLDRGPTYCIEWCVLVGVAVAAVAMQIPFISGWAWWWGGAVFAGCLVHVLADWVTPTGVPLSAIWNLFRHREVWHRHSLGWSSTDSAGDMFLAVAAMFVLTVLTGLAMIGWLAPLLRQLMGWGS